MLFRSPPLPTWVYSAQCSIREKEFNSASCLSRFSEMPDSRGVPTQNLTDHVRVENEAGHSSIDDPEAHAGATEQRVEVVPPLLAVIVRLLRDPLEPPP